MVKYAAFLRGINVGGKKPVAMQKLKIAFDAMQFKGVQTLLASGNVLFEAPPTDAIALEHKIEQKLKETFGRDIGVLIRTIEELEHLSNSRPFTGIDVTPESRLYITFFSEKPKGGLKIPYTSPDKSYKILRVSGREVSSVLVLSSNSRTVDLMKVLEKEFGGKVTTRNWNTIIRLLKTQRV